MYEFPGTCNYVFASECKNTFPLFNIQLKRASSGNIERILVDLRYINIQVLNGAIKVGSLQDVQLPYSSVGFQIKPYGSLVQLYIKQDKLELTVEWNNKDYLMSLLCTELLNMVAPDCKIDKNRYIYRCQHDLCHCTPKGRKECSCGTLSEYSRRCSWELQPVTNWRSQDLCSPEICPSNQEFKECGNPCIPSCTNPLFSCLTPCIYGCFCPAGTILDNISKNSTCVRHMECPCVLNGLLYQPQDTVNYPCRSCVCAGGKWDCEEHPCSQHCAVEGGSFVTTFDSRKYRFHGVCSYVLVKSPMMPDKGRVLGIFDKCGISSSETCLAAIRYVSSKVAITIDKEDVMIFNRGTQKLPFKTEHFTIFRQSSTYVQMNSDFGLMLQIQTQPILIVYMYAAIDLFDTTKGLCGNYNEDSTDDFMNSMGVLEGTVTRFISSWQTDQCKKAKAEDPDPCSSSMLNALFAQTHCSVLLNHTSVFGKCHSLVDPNEYFKRCKYDSCNYEETQLYLCASLGAYAHACAAQGVILENWRNETLSCTIACPMNQEFNYSTEACGTTCQSRENQHLECFLSIVPVEGCNCPPGTYQDHQGKCVTEDRCPCYLENNLTLPPDHSTTLEGLVCTCRMGELDCTGMRSLQDDKCTPPAFYHTCMDQNDIVCAPTCHNWRIDNICCSHILYCTLYSPSTCKQGMWICVKSAFCPGSCIHYGEGHLITFDSHSFSFDGPCEYTLVTDSCGDSIKERFSIVSRSIMCGSGGTCSRVIVVTVETAVLELQDGQYKITPDSKTDVFKVLSNSMNLIITMTIPISNAAVTLIWNKNVNLIIQLTKVTEMSLCGLCGNFNGKVLDDLTLRDGALASFVKEFFNSWRVDPNCMEIPEYTDPCIKNPYRLKWAQEKCSIIPSNVFEECHELVQYNQFYDACVHDACQCDSGEDCECVCNAVAIYAKLCLDNGICVDWRRPDFCPVYCDFYNTHTKVTNQYEYTGDENCTWHYQPCECPFSIDNQKITHNIEGRFWHLFHS
ncbi:mucin-6-like [Acipenser ruthenus]|uniref:mucin-6-like n=1 Tax=Acipenser ruthenus TaxID=7906 RepID=UPI0027422C79|nr:mucin-6-like [Acipenser ruthenus]